MAAIDGAGKDFIIGKNQVIILPTIGKEKRVNFSEIIKVQYRIATLQLNGEITVVTKFGEKFTVSFRKTQNDNFKQVVQILEDNLENAEFLLLEGTQSTPMSQTMTPSKQSGPKEPLFGPKIRCPKCKGHNIEVLTDHVSQKTSTSLNLNPLHPLTVFNTKQKKNKKVSLAKTGAAMVTLGMSTVFTGGIKSDKGNIGLFCKDCGYRWTQK